MQLNKKIQMPHRLIFLTVGLFLLNGCVEKTNKHIIAKIPEASGICYSTSNNTLFVAQDEGGIVEINSDGKILRKVNIGKYDLEGVACDDSTLQLYFAVEKKESILVVDMKSLQITKEVKIDRDYQGQTVIAKDKKHGIEGITIINGDIYLCNQSYERYPNRDASILFKVDGIKGTKTQITEIFDHGFVDVAGLSYHHGYLYMVSDKEDLLIKYDIHKHKIVKTTKLKKFAQEGITFDEIGNIYFADDNGAVLKYKSKKFE